MHIMINISPDLYTRLVDNGVDLSDADKKSLEIAVRKGTVLPENHGNLKDENDVKRELIEEYRNIDILKRCLDKAPTIIEGTEDEE